jgi:hypothetical protein
LIRSVTSLLADKMMTGVFSILGLAFKDRKTSPGKQQVQDDKAGVMQVDEIQTGPPISGGNHLESFAGKAMRQ